MPYGERGFVERYLVRRVDGKPTAPEARYFVLNFDGSDPHAIRALQAYADSVKTENPELADDLEAAIANPEEAPAQHIHYKP